MVPAEGENTAGRSHSPHKMNGNSERHAEWLKRRDYDKSLSYRSAREREVLERMLDGGGNSPAVFRLVVSNEM